MHRRLTATAAVLIGTAAQAQMVGSAVLTGATATAAGKAGRTAASSIQHSLGRAASALGSAAAGGSQPVPIPEAAPPSAVRPALPAAAAAPPERTLTRAELETVEIGISREALLARCGAPRSRITVFEDGRLDEAFRYRTTGGEAKVRLLDGKVASIDWQ
ncbi:MAG: hypothetical protein SFV54_20680 [Bryobacteraceae bacterium]|nr:hypothetical protein [Bryobacteraceae bacterium]